MNRDEARTLFEQVKANSAAIRACPRHRFIGGHEVKLGEKHTCLVCRGEMRLTDIGPYIQGYEAAGGKADDIWPGYREKRP